MSREATDFKVGDRVQARGVFPTLTGEVLSIQPSIFTDEVTVKLDKGRRTEMVFYAAALERIDE